MPIAARPPCAKRTSARAFIALAALGAALACESGGSAPADNPDQDAGAGGAGGAAGGAIPGTGGGGGESAPAADLGATADASQEANQGAADGTPPDVAASGEDAAAPEPDSGASTGCPDLPVIAADGPRVVLIGHPFTERPEVPGTEIRGLTLQPDATLADDGIRLDVGEKPVRIAFAPHGLYAFVLGENGTLVSVFVAAAEGMAVVDRVVLPAAGYGDLHVSADGTTVWVTGSNVDASSGISTVDVDCEGNLTVDEDAFFPLRLAESTAFLPGDGRALVMGGQAVFEPVDPNDVRLVQRLNGNPRRGFEEVGAFDLYHDFVGAGRIAVSPDGRTGAIPNNSAFSEEGAQMMLVSIDGDTVSEVDRLHDVFDPSEALFSLDGQTLVLSQVQPGRLSVHRLEDGRITASSELRGVGLADQMARVERGPLADTLLIPSIDPDGGPNITLVRITGPGQVEDLGQTSIGDGSVNIATPIAVQP